MPCTPELSSKIAEESIKAMSGQIDFVHGLSLAVLGGILALALQVALHNRQKDSNKLTLKRPLILLLGIVLPAISMTLGIFAKGSLTSSTPSLLKYDFCVIERLGKATFDSAAQLAALAAGQSYTFLAGIVAMALFAWLNRDLLN
jgi:hypothetical protein